MASYFTKRTDGLEGPLLPLLRLLRVRVSDASTLPAGLSRECGDLLFYLLAFAFRTSSFGFFIFAETLYHRKLLPAGFAEILIRRHVLPSISGLFIAIFFGSILVKYHILSSVVIKELQKCHVQDINNISFADRKHGKDGVGCRRWSPGH